MKNISISLLAICLSVQIASAGQENLFESFADKADLIVEGYVANQMQTDLKAVPAVIPQSRQSMFFKFGRVQRTQFDVLRVYKGLSSKNIDIVSSVNANKSIDQLKTKRKYILFLKRHPKIDGYVIMNRERLQWQVFDYDGELRVKSWQQFPQLRSKDNYLAYSQFIDELHSVLSQGNELK